MKKIFLFLVTALLSLAVSAEEYNVLITSFNVDVNADNNIEFTSQLNGATLTEGDVINLTLKGYFDAPAIVTYNTIADNAADACGEGTNCYWAQLAEWESVELGTAVIGEEFEVTKSVTITTTALTNEKYVVQLGFSFASLKDKKKYQQFKFRPTAEALSANAKEYNVSVPTLKFGFDGNKNYKAEVPFETEAAMKTDDILKVTINGKFSENVQGIVFMVFDNDGNEVLGWSVKSNFQAAKDMTVNETLDLVMPVDCPTTAAKLGVFIEEYDAEKPISFLKDGDVAHEPVELAVKEYNTEITLSCNEYITPHNYQFIDAAIAENVLVGDYVTFSISGVPNKAFAGDLKAYLRNGVEGGSYAAISDYTIVTSNVEANGEITYSGILSATSAAEICDLVLEITDEAEEGASIVIAPEGTQVHEGVELTSKEFTTLTLAANVWDEGSNYQYVEELTAPEEGFLKGDFVSLSINGVASNDIAKLQVALIGSEYNNVSDYVTIAENVKAGDAITFSKKLVLNSATDVCNLTITTTDAVADDIEAITIEGGDLPHVAVELAQKEFTSLTLAANDWGTGSNYQSEAVEIEKPEAGFFEGDYVSFTIKGVADNAITTLQVVLVDDSWSAVSEYTPVTTEAIEKDGSVDITGKVELTKATEVCKLVFNTTDAVVEGVETIKIVSADGPVHVAVELAQKDFTSLTMVANVWDAGSNYQYVEELTAPEEGFQEGDYVTVTITGVASHNIEGLQVALIDGSWNAVSAYTSLATGIKAGEEVSITKAIPLTKATDVCKLTITTTDPAADGVAEIKIEPKNVAVEEVAASAFAVEGGMVYSAGEIVVYNVAGKQVASASKAFNVNSLAAGVYFITAQEGTIKFVK